MKNKLFIITLSFSVVLLTFNSCNKDEENEYTDTPIIEAYLQTGNYFNLKISRQIPFSDNPKYSSDDINNLDISVSFNDEIYKLTPLDSGNYVDSSLMVEEGDEYLLTFEFNLKNVSAYTYVPTKPLNITESDTLIYIERMDSTSGPPSSSMPDPVEITWDNVDASYYLLVVQNLEDSLDPIRDFGDEEAPGNMFRKSPTNSSEAELRANDFQYYGMHRIILFHVLPDYAALFEQNGSSSQNLTNPSTSIVNGYGIFTGINSDTLYLDVKED